MSQHNAHDRESPRPRIWRVIDLINWGSDYLQSKNVSNGRREVEWFLCSILNCRRIDLYLQFEQPVVGDELQRFKKYILRRVKGEPFQHILGIAPFYGRDFLVNREVMIPRPETEIIIEILKSAAPFDSLLEIGTGSGCLAVTAVLEEVTQSCIATDISRDALAAARKNASQFQAEGISFRRHDFLADPIQSQFDCIISNPPYIALSELPELDSVVKNFDPEEALTDGADGLTFYHRFAEIGSDILKTNGLMLLEMGGSSQVESITQIFRSHDYSVHFHKDLQGEERVAEIHRINKE